MLIDCGAGMGVRAICESIEQLGFRLMDITHIFLTHGHADHSGGTAQFQRLTGASVVCSSATARMMCEGDEAAIGLTAAREAGIYPADYRLEPCRPDIELRNGDSLKVGDLTIKAIETPGHSYDMICAYCPELQYLFSSDVVFDGGRIAALSTPDFSMNALRESIQKLSALEIKGLFPGHLAPVTKEAIQAVRIANNLFRQGMVPDSIV